MHIHGKPRPSPSATDLAVGSAAKRCDDDRCARALERQQARRIAGSRTEVRCEFWYKFRYRHKFGFLTLSFSKLFNSRYLGFAPSYFASTAFSAATTASFGTSSKGSEFWFDETMVSDSAVEPWRTFLRCTQLLPKSFFVGDSISIYYTPFVQTDVSTSYSFSRKTSPKPESIVEQLGFHGPYGILSWFYVSHCISTSGQGYGDV